MTWRPWMTNHIMHCTQCKTEFYRAKSTKSQNVFCSVQCHGLWSRKDGVRRVTRKNYSYIRTPNCSCRTCDKKIYRRPVQIQSGNVYCSQSCKGIFTRKGRGNCKTCNIEISQIGKPGGRPWKTYCSRSCANKGRVGTKYKQEISLSKHKRSQNLKAMLIDLRGPKCEKCPCDIIGILHCHHILEVSNGGDDTPENLMLLCPNCHYTEHHGFMTWEEFLSSK